MTYHPLLKSMEYIINNHLDILYMNDTVKFFFSPRWMIRKKS